MTEAQKASAWAKAEDDFDRLVLGVPDALCGTRLVNAVIDSLTDNMSDRPTPGELFLCSMAALAIVRLIELERGERSIVA